MKPQPDLSIVIPAYNEEKYIAECLDSICKYSPSGLTTEVIVVDNGSDDKTLEVAATFEHVKVLTFPEGNVGAVRNFGAENSSANVLAFIDADCLITESWIETVVRVCSDQPDTVYGGGCKLRADPTWVERYWLLEKEGQPTLPKQLIGASIALEKSAFEKLGGFPEDVTSGEDSMLSKKVHESRYKLRIIPELTVTHLGNALTIRDFFKRQIWHSENYVKRPLASLKDPVFILVCLFGMFLVASALFGANGDTLFWPSIVAAVAVPAILSFKRIARAQMVGLRVIKDLPGIYCLDFVYVAGRLVGTFGGGLRMVRSGVSDGGNC